MQLQSEGNYFSTTYAALRSKALLVCFLSPIDFDHGCCTCNVRN